MKINYKKAISFVLIIAIAVVSGFSIGKIFLDSTTIDAQTVTESEEKLRDDESAIKALYERAMNGASVDSFSGIELYQIAEYKMNQSQFFMREMFGETLSTGQTAILRTQRIKMNDDLVFYKLSPAKRIIGNLSTPNLCSKFSYSLKNENKINLSMGSEKCFLDTSAKDKLDAVFSDVVESLEYSKSQYMSDFKTTPKTSVLPYIISSKTCSLDCISDFAQNEDGTYSYKINLSGDNLNKAAMYYTYEIMYTSGYFSYAFSKPGVSEAQPLKRGEGVSWKNAELTVTIDADFNFKHIGYVENYSLGSEAIPVVKKAECKDTFDDFFYFDEESIFEHAFSDFKQSQGRA